VKEDSNFFSEELSANERDLYDRQFRLEGWSQQIVKNATVLIAGIGGLGCEIAKNLAMVGVGRLDLVDMDIIEYSNLNRQILFVDAEMGESKAIAAAKKLKDINPFIEINGYNTSLERLDPILYKQADVIVGGLDSMNARLNLNAQAIRFDKPFIDGGVSGYHGHIYSIFPYENACYECNPLPTSEIDDMAACTVVGIPRKRIHCVFKANMSFEEEHERGPNVKNIKEISYIQEKANELAEKHNFLPLFNKSEIIKILDQHDPGIITINAIISSLQSHEVIKVLHWLKNNTALGEPVKNYVVFNAMTLKFYRIQKQRNSNCIQCGNNVRREEITINPTDECEKIIDKLKQKGYRLDLDMEPILTLLDFDDIKIVDLDESSEENKLRDLELITAAGFHKGEVYVTLRIKD
jgi:molybdopterin/thiamine biosynthesis adenylyltransferase